jgi:hypothetical protein
MNMKMQRALFIHILLILYFSWNTVEAQRLKLSTEPLDDTGLDYAKVIGDADDGVFVLHSNFSLETERDRIGLKSRKYQLSFYDYNLKRIWNQTIAPQRQGASLENVAFFNNRVIILSSQLNKSSNQYEILVDVIDNDGKLIYKSVLVSKFTRKKGSSIEKPKLILDPSKQKAAIYIAEQTDREQLIYITTIDTGITSLGSSSGSIQYSEKDLLTTDFILGNNHELMVLAQLKERDSSEKKKQLLYKLFYLPKAAKQFKEYRVNNSDRPMTEASLTFDKFKNTALVIGFYADQNSFAGVGIMFSALNLEKADSLLTYTYPIKGDAQLKLVGERNSGNGISLFSYPIQKVILRSDGGAVIIAEAAYMSEFSYYDYFTQSFNRRVEYHFDNIVTFSINSNGTVDWSQVIRKEQASMDDMGIYASFSSYLNTEEIGIIYNKDIGKNNAIVLKVINNKGQLSDRNVTKPGDNMVIIPRSGKQVDESTVMLPIINKKRLYLAKIEL